MFFGIKEYFNALSLKELGGSHFRFNTHGDFMLENTQLGGIPYEPVLGSTSILTPNSIDQIIGPSAAATLKNGKDLLKYHPLDSQGPTAWAGFSKMN